MEKVRLYDNDARQVIYNVYLYFVNEAVKFQRKEDGYFQKVYERLSTACCVSRAFIVRLLKENLDEGSTKNKMWRDKRRQQAKKLRQSISDSNYKHKTSEDAKKKVQDRTPLPEPPPLVKKPEIQPITETFTAQELPPLTAFLNPEMPLILKPFVIKSTSPPPLTPIIRESSKSFPMNPQIPTKSEILPEAIKTADNNMNPSSSYTIPSESSPMLGFVGETFNSNVWIKYESDLSDYDESTLS